MSVTLDRTKAAAVTTERPIYTVVGYAVILAVAEAVTLFGNPLLGLVLYSDILIVLLLHATFDWERPMYRPLLAFALVPLLRMLSLALPLDEFSRIYWYALIAVPMLIAAVMIARLLRLSRFDLGLSLRGESDPIQLLVALTGISLGAVQYQILKPEPLIDSLTLREFLLPALILLVFSGFTEEFLFRGVLHRAAVMAIGSLGMITVAVLYASLQMGHASWLIVPFALGVSLFFHWIVARTNSLFGVALAHGLINIMTFLVLPFVA